MNKNTLMVFLVCALFGLRAFSQEQTRIEYT
jgi:hypothetical protein